MKINFESTLEKVGRIIARQYGIEVRFEGNECKTDGKTIVLPHFESLDDELKRDMHGFLDHEVAHCKFTDFKVNPKTKFHKVLLNAVEDSRIEKEMIEEFPGCALHLIPMNEKLRSKINAEENWSKLPYPVRTIIAIRDLMDGREPRIDEDIERYIDVVKDAAVQLSECKTTKELHDATAEIVKMIIEEREEEKKEEKKSKGKGKAPKGMKGMPSGAGGSGDDEMPDDFEDEEEDDGSGKGDEEGEDKSKGDEMLDESADEKDSEFDKHITTVGEMMEKEIAKAVKKDAEELKKGGGKFLKPEFGTQISVPVTTRFDKVTDYSGKGDARNYGRLKDQVKPQVAPIKQTLERILKVKENAKWRTEQERGRLNPRDLAKLATDKSYRTPFREFTKTETKNVAIEILIDESGSMSGSKTHTTKMAAIAFAEALKDLQIPFEITGFTSVPDSKVSAYASTLGREALGRFNRTSERLELDIFKSFESHSLLGLDKIKANCQNPDGECVAWAAKRLALRKEKRKILMVLSDGQPATGDGGHSRLCTDLRKKVELIIKSGIEVVGIGIETNAVKDYYPDYLVLNDVKELPVAGMRKLSKLIAKG